MNISDMWLEACDDEDFVIAIINAVDMEEIPMEEWALVDILYLNAVVTVDVFHDFETDSYVVYPTFLHRTLADQSPIIVRLKND